MLVAVAPPITKALLAKPVVTPEPLMIWVLVLFTDVEKLTEPAPVPAKLTRLLLAAAVVPEGVPVVLAVLLLDRLRQSPNCNWARLQSWWC